MTSPNNIEEGEPTAGKDLKNRNTRGITKMKAVNKSRKLGRKLEVGWNSKGQPVDPNRSSFIHFVGYVTISVAPISYSDWANVPSDLKDFIWEKVEGVHDKHSRAIDMHQSFEVQPEHKHYVLALAGRDMRSFRTRMRKYIYDEDGNCVSEPQEKYHRFVTVADHWMEFVRQSTTEDFKRDSEANAERAKGISYRYRKPSKGYAQLEQELIASSESHMTSIPRHVLWKAAKVNKTGAYDEGVQNIVHQFETLSKNVPEGESQSTGRNDILSQVLGVPEHLGRVRAARFIVTQKIEFGSSPSTPHPSSSEWQNMKHWVAHLTQVVSNLTGGQGMPPFMPHQMPFDATTMAPPFMSTQGIPPPFMPSQPTPIVDRQRGRCTPARSIEIPPGDHDCLLHLNNPNRIVARGRVFHTDVGDTLHTRPLPTNHAKVIVEIVQRHEDDTPLPVPIEEANIFCLRDAVGTYVAWPLSLINLQLKVQATSTKGKVIDTGHANESVVGPNAKGVAFSSDLTQFAAAQGGACIDMMKLFVRSDHAIDQATIQLNEKHWGKTFEDSIGKENILEVIRRQLLSASSICLYIRYLCEAYLQGTDKERRFLFISPYEIDEKLNANPHQHISDMLKLHMDEDHLMFAPCNVGGHWIFIAINPSNDTIYYMDPLRRQHKFRTQMVNIFNNGLNTYRAVCQPHLPRAKMNQTNWVNVQMFYSMDKLPSQLIIFQMFGSQAFLISELSNFKGNGVHIYIAHM